MNKEILWLPGWYPSKIDAFTGDFIQRHAKALALFAPVHVLFIVRDKDGVVTNSVYIEEKTTGNLSETIIYYATKKYSLPLADKMISTWKFNKVSRQYLKKLFENKKVPDTIHVHVAYKAGLTALWLKNKFKLDYFVTEHWTGYDRSMPGNYFSMPRPLQYIIKRIFSNAKTVIPVSEDLGKKISAIVPSVLINAIPNVVDERLFYFEPKKDNMFRIIHNVSSAKEQKNTEGLLHVLSQLHKIKPGWECIMYGPVSKGLTELTDQIGLKDIVKFTGEIPYSEVAKIVRTATVYVSFSNYENQPCSILEALCCGVPVIATRVGGIPEIINSKNGLLVDAQNEKQLLQAIDTFMERSLDYKREEIAAEAKSKFSFESVGKQLYSLYTV